MSSAAAPTVSFEREVDDGTKWSVLLAPWFGVFSSSSAVFGLVDDWRADGSSFKRHGVIVELRADVTDAVLNGETGAAHLQQLREVVDLVQLLLTVKPSAIASLLTAKNNAYNIKNPSTYGEELSAMARGVPLELQLRLKFESIETALLAPQLIDVFLQQIDGVLSVDVAFTTQRQKLVDKLCYRPEACKRLGRSVGVRIKLVIDSAETEVEAVAQQDSEQFFADLAGFVSDAQQYSHTRQQVGDSIAVKHVPLLLEKVELRLRRMYITPAIIDAVGVINAVGFPVELARLSLDFQLITCDDHGLNEFVQAITSGAGEIMVDTGTWDDSRRGIVADAQGQDFHDHVRKILKAIASIHSVHGVDMGGILRQCSTPKNREAVWCGLFEDVLSRRLPIKLLRFQDGVKCTEQDGVWITQCAARWRHENPGRTLRVEHLDVHLDATTNSVEDLLAAFGDVNKLSVHFHSCSDFWLVEAFSRIFRYPSLRSLSLTNVTLATMEVFDPSAVVRFRETRPNLRELSLHSCLVMQQRTVSSFLEKLEPWGAVPSELSQTLRVFRFLERSTSSGATITLVDEALATNRTLAEVEVTVSRSDEAGMSARRKLLRKVKLRKCVVVADRNDRQWAVAKARHAAFLSTLRHEAVDTAARGVRAQLDSRVVRRIFAFSAPHVECKVSVSVYEDVKRK